MWGGASFLFLSLAAIKALGGFTTGVATLCATGCVQFAETAMCITVNIKLTVDLNKSSNPVSMAFPLLLAASALKRNDERLMV
ncbi:hypothetical protein BC629DRAFT_1531726, partial [Irpex lacteus]